MTKITDKPYLEEIRIRISELNLGDSFFLITYPIDFIAWKVRMADGRERKWRF